MTGHQSSGTAGHSQPAGSELSAVCEGTASVPSSPRQSSNESVSVSAPPQTHPNGLSEE